MVPESFAITWREKKYYTQFRRRKTLRTPGRMIKQFTKDVISLNAFSVALRIFAGLLLAMTNAMIPSLLLSSLLLPLFLSPFCTYKSIFQIHPRFKILKTELKFIKPKAATEISLLWKIPALPRTYYRYFNCSIILLYKFLSYWPFTIFSAKIP